MQICQKFGLLVCTAPLLKLFYSISLHFFRLFVDPWISQVQEGHDGPEIAHLSLLTKHAPSSFPVT